MQCTQDFRQVRRIPTLTILTIAHRFNRKNGTMCIEASTVLFHRSLYHFARIARSEAKARRLGFAFITFGNVRFMSAFASAFLHTFQRH